MTDLTVFVAPFGIAGGVKDVLRDLSAANLLHPFMWIDGHNAGAMPVRAVRIHGGREFDTTLQEAVSSQRIDVLRLAVLVPLSGAAAALNVDVERQIAEMLASTSGGAKMVRIRLLLARPDSAPTPGAVVALDGWHNVLLAPEESRGPGMGHIALGSTAEPTEIGRHAAPVAAALTGLWTDVDHTPLDDEPVLPGHLVRLARSFYRRLDTSVAEESLRSQILAQDGGLPLPRESGAPVSYINDVSLATRSMSEDLWRKHAGVLKGPRAPYALLETKNLGFFAALKMFFSFMWAALLNAPSAWYARVVNSVSSSVANAVHDAVFGSGSAYEVVVNGRNSAGDRASWTEIGDASNRLGGVLDGPGDERHHSARVDLSDLWQDYARGALTLADAGARSTDLPPVQVGASRGVLRRAADAVPGPAERFHQIPGIVAATVGVQSVDATDAMGIVELRNKLQVLDQDPNLGLEARRTAAALEGWQRSGSESYGVVVGQAIASQFHTTFQEVQGLLRKLNNTKAAAPIESAPHLRLARWIQITSILLILIFAGAGFAIAKNYIEWWKGALIIIGALLLWVIVLVLVFMRSQQDLFQRLNAARKDAADIDVDTANLRTGLRDLDRLTGAYSQYLVWSRALGTFLAEPLGPDSSVSQYKSRIEWGLPKNTSIGYASPEGEQLSTTSQYLRQDLFGLGWLSSPWDTLLDSAGESLGSHGRDISANPSALFSDGGAGTGSPLEQWSTSFFAGKITSSGAELMWDKAKANLLGPKSELVRALINRVDVYDDGNTTSTGIDEFMAGVTDQATGRTDHFDRGMVSDMAATDGRTAVKDDIRVTSFAGIGTVSVVTQLSDGLSVDDLMLATNTPAAPEQEWEVPTFPTPAARTSPAPAADEGFRF